MGWAQSGCLVCCACVCAADNRYTGPSGVSSFFIAFLTQLRPRTYCRHLLVPQARYCLPSDKTRLEAHQFETMLAVETRPAPLFRKQSIFRRFSKKEKPLQISYPIVDEAPLPYAQPPPRSPRKLVRRSIPKDDVDRIPATPPVLPPLDTTPAQSPRVKITHTRNDSGTFPDLPISQQFSRSPSSSPTPSQHPNNLIRSSTDSTSSSYPRVSRNAHATSPFPHNTRIGPWNLFLPPAQVHALYTGFFPEDMADEWFVFSEGPDVNGKLKVHFHRAWTGLKVAELFVVMDLKGEGAGKVVGIKWNGSEQTGRMGEEGAKGTIRLACGKVLGCRLEGEAF